MPAESKSQYRMMQAVLGNKSKKKGKKRPSKKVAKEYVEATPSYGALPEKKGKKGGYY